MRVRACAYMLEGGQYYPKAFQDTIVVLCMSFGAPGGFLRVLSRHGLFDIEGIIPHEKMEPRVGRPTNAKGRAETDPARPAPSSDVYPIWVISKRKTNENKCIFQIQKEKAKKRKRCTYLLHVRCASS